MFISDRKEVLMMMTPETAEEEHGIWLSSPYLTESLCAIIDSSLKNGNGK
jgi:hypothetical protein